MEIPDPKFTELRLLLECQVKIAIEEGFEFMECYETLKILKERFGKQKKHLDDIEKITAFVLYKDHKLENALEMYKRIVARKLKDTDEQAQMLSMCAKVQADLEQYPDAIVSIEEALKLTPNRPNLYFLHAVIHHKQSQSDEALKMLEKMGEFLKEGDDSGRVTRLHLEASIFSAKADHPSAIRRLEECVELCKDKDAEEMRLRKIYDDLGAIYHILKDEEKTLAYYNLAHPEGEEEGEEEQEHEEEEEEGGEKK
jgi:tetratricopeptide (TPR) repeat protein